MLCCQASCIHSSSRTPTKYFCMQYTCECLGGRDYVLKRNYVCGYTTSRSTSVWARGRKYVKMLVSKISVAIQCTMTVLLTIGRDLCWWVDAESERDCYMCKHVSAWEQGGVKTKCS